MTTADLTKIRSRAWVHLNSPDVAAACGMQQSELQGFALRTYNPTPQQLAALADYFNVCVEPA